MNQVSLAFFYSTFGLNVEKGKQKETSFLEHRGIQSRWYCHVFARQKPRRGSCFVAAAYAVSSILLVGLAVAATPALFLFSLAWLAAAWPRTFSLCLRSVVGRLRLLLVSLQCSVFVFFFCLFCRSLSCRRRGCGRGAFFLSASSFFFA